MISVSGERRVAGERGRVGGELLEVEFLHPPFVGVEHDEAVAEPVERPRDHQPRLAQAAEEVERLAQKPDRAAEPRGDDGRLEALVLRQARAGCRAGRPSRSPTGR